MYVRWWISVHYRSTKLYCRGICSSDKTIMWFRNKAGQSFITVDPFHNLIPENDVYTALYMDLHKAGKRIGSLPLGTSSVLHVISELLECFPLCVHDTIVSMWMCVCPAPITFELIQCFPQNLIKSYKSKLSNICSLYLNFLTNSFVRYISLKVGSFSRNYPVLWKFKAPCSVHTIVLIEYVVSQLI